MMIMTVIFLAVMTNDIDDNDNNDNDDNDNDDNGSDFIANVVNSIFK